jgi:hypothetical protein
MITALLLLALTFEPPAPKVTAIYHIVASDTYLVVCDDKTRHSVTKQQAANIQIGDTCPSD